MAKKKLESSQEPQPTEGDSAAEDSPSPLELRALIAIPTCKADKHLEDACRATWVRPYFVWPLERPINVWTEFFDGETLGCPDTYESLPIKIQMICRWALAKYFDFMLKVDSDTYVWIDRILASGFEKHDYSGWALPKIAPENNYASGGAGYWLSRKSMEIIATAKLTSDTCEDRWVGRVLYDAGIRLHRNELHGHGRHEEVGETKFLTMHPCRELRWMKAMQDS